MVQNLKLKSLLLLCVVICLVFILGHGIGRIGGDHAVKTYLRGESRMRLLFDNPGPYFIRVYQALYSKVDMVRAAAYYGLSDIGTVDTAFLEKRFHEEEHLYARKIILWVLSHASNKSDALATLTQLYNLADISLKQVIIHYIAIADAAYADELLKKSSEIVQKKYQEATKEVRVHQSFIM